MESTYVIFGMSMSPFPCTEASREGGRPGREAGTAAGGSVPFVRVYAK